MKYAFKKRAWADKEPYEVRDEVLDVVLKVVPRPGMFVQEVILNDPYGNYIGHIRQKYFTLNPVFSIYHEKKLWGGFIRPAGCSVLFTG